MKEIIVNLSNGAFYKVDRQEIKKRFCFGYGYCGVSDTEEERRAAKSVQLMRESEKTFIEENLKFINGRIEFVTENLNKNFYGLFNYTDKRIDLQNEENYYYFVINRKIYKDSDFILLTEQDKRLILEGLELEKASFIKRLNTYLKRYGLSKVRTWSYLVD